MAIEISVIKSPEHVQLGKVCQVFTEQGGTIGRGESNTWVISDPERFISSTHTQIEFENGQYYLSDVSTNGTFLNGSEEPIGNGNRVLLKDGDNFSLGDYEFQVNINQPRMGIHSAGDDPFANANFSEQDRQDNMDLFSSGNQYAHYDDPFASQGSDAMAISDMLPVTESEEKDPLALLDKVGHNQQSSDFFVDSIGSTQEDHADPMRQAVVWPNAIPDDWDQDEEDLPISAPVETPKIISKTGPVAVASHDLLEKLRVSEQKREALEIENDRLLSDVMQLKQKLHNLQNMPAKNSAHANTGHVDETLLDAMGLGKWKLPDKKKAEISVAVGYLVRESIHGLMQTLGFRKKIKEEFRINVTTIQPVENNPLKFSANIDDALENMFIKENKAYMGPLEAVREGFQGISEHQIALLAGIQAAFRGMIERLDPEALEKRFEKYRKTGVIKMGQRGKNWESYKEFHQDLVNNLDNSFQYLFGYDFVQAYEEQLQRLLVARKSKSKK